MYFIYFYVFRKTEMSHSVATLPNETIIMEGLEDLHDIVSEYFPVNNETGGVVNEDDNENIVEVLRQLESVPNESKVEDEQTVMKDTAYKNVARSKKQYLGFGETRKTSIKKKKVKRPKVSLEEQSLMQELLEYANNIDVSTTPSDEKIVPTTVEVDEENKGVSSSGGEEKRKEKSPWELRKIMVDTLLQNAGKTVDTFHDKPKTKSHPLPVVGTNEDSSQEKVQTSRKAQRQLVKLQQEKEVEKVRRNLETLKRRAEVGVHRNKKYLGFGEKRKSKSTIVSMEEKNLIQELIELTKVSSEDSNTEM